jgi:hypothetical protein
MQGCAPGCIVTVATVARPQERKFLGFSFTAGPEVKRVIVPKALDRFKRSVWEITRKAKGVRVALLKRWLMGTHQGAVSRVYLGYLSIQPAQIQEPGQAFLPSS